MLVLYVDDDHDDRDLFWEVTKEIDSRIKIVVARNGQEALDLLHEEKWLSPDIIFIDINMPVMNGFQTLVELRKIKRLENTKLVMYSTSINQKATLACKDSNVPFIKKGNTMSDIKKELKLIFEK
jgi:CheY-like chemotaxis protein